jgi:hypothetical protein
MSSESNDAGNRGDDSALSVGATPIDEPGRMDRFEAFPA